MEDSKEKKEQIFCFLNETQNYTVPFKLVMFITFGFSKIACDYYPKETCSHSIVAHNGT